MGLTVAAGQGEYIKKRSLGVYVWDVQGWVVVA